jgi:hypothetical protein
VDDSPEFRPPATPGLKVVGEGAGEVEEAAVSTFVGSSELGRWGNSGAAELEDRRRSVLGGGALRCGRGGGGSSGRGELLRGCSGAFIGAGGGRRRDGQSKGGGEWRLRPLRRD